MTADGWAGPEMSRDKRDSLLLSGPPLKPHVRSRRGSALAPDFTLNEHHCLYDAVPRDWQASSVRGWRVCVFYFRAVWSLRLPLNAAITDSNKIETNGHDHIPIKLHLRMVNSMLFSIINDYSFSNYFQPFKNIQSFVSSWTVQEQAMGLIWSVYPT